MSIRNDARIWSCIPLDLQVPTEAEEGIHVWPVNQAKDQLMFEIIKVIKCHILHLINHYFQATSHCHLLNLLVMDALVESSILAFPFFWALFSIKHPFLPL